MKLTPATIHDAEEISDLVNSAYRGDTSRLGWTTEADYLEGARITVPRTKELIQPESGKNILVLREDGAAKPIIGCVYLEKCDIRGEPGYYLGMLTVNPKMQDKGLGRVILEKAEDFARDCGAVKMVLGVIQLRGTLMAWYERRGYKSTGEKKPFPYDQPEVGIPKRDDLHFIMFEKDLK